MKRLLTVILALLIILPAAAEERSGFYWNDAHPDVTVACDFAGEYKGDPYFTQHILRILLRDTKTGQEIGEIFALTEFEHWGVAVEDVNFDGHNDIVVTTVGALNTSYQFFMWDVWTESFVLAGPPVWNYVLYPEKQRVLSYMNNGSAGLLHSSEAYVWQGNALALTCSATWDTYSEERYDSDGNGFTVSTYYDDHRITETYVDHMTGDVMEFTFAADDYSNDTDFYHEREAYEREFLGL